MKLPQKLIKYYLPVFVWAGVIFTFSTLPTGPGQKIIWTDFIIKKTAHLTEYAIFAILIYRAIINTSLRAKNISGYTAIFLSMLYGATDEFHQSFTPGRTPKLYDIGFDTIGATLGILIIWKLLPKMPPKLKNLAKNLDLVSKGERSSPSKEI
jgi:VanZ family protein